MVVQVVRSLAIITLSLSIIYVAGTAIIFGLVLYGCIHGPTSCGLSNGFDIGQIL